ncbi:MAG: zinc ribbon domain-containing protein, partial [Nitrososphaerota archaeon]|nr:zinc ribbon domain-containing protein [Nitrososphaerota archaeon]
MAQGMNQNFQSRSCPNCGSIISATAKFCPNCGATMASQQGPQAPAGSSKFCPNCGSPVTAGSKFCNSCGTKL